MATQPELPSSAETVRGILDASKRTSRSVQIRRTFVQQGPQSDPRPGPLRGLVRRHAARALDVYLLHRALATHEPWETSLAAETWARTVRYRGVDPRGALSRTWRTLEQDHNLIRRSGRRRKGIPTIVTLKDDGHGAEYTSPDGKTRAEQYFGLPFEYWLNGWDERLGLAAKAMLLISLSLTTRPQKEFHLPIDKAEVWYGLSADTADRGLRELRDTEILTARTIYVPNVLAATGWIERRMHHLQEPFGAQAPVDLSVPQNLFENVPAS